MVFFVALPGIVNSISLSFIILFNRRILSCVICKPCPSFLFRLFKPITIVADQHLHVVFLLIYL